MSTLKKLFRISTAFDQYVIDELIGEGGAGRVYGGSDSSNNKIAVKSLIAKNTEQQKRFKNEINFLFRNKHNNIVAVIDFGIGQFGDDLLSFYVMKRYDSSLRSMMKGHISPDKAVKIFLRILDGVEAFHMFGVFHRDIKPENILVSKNGEDIAISDFGIAHFKESLLETNIHTKPSSRLANFLYAAPEQRMPGAHVDSSCDIYALGLILNEMFTREVPHGTGAQKISDASPLHAYLDPLVEAMLQQNPKNRPQSIAEIKNKIALYHDNYVIRQRISEIDNTVVDQEAAIDSLATSPPHIISATWDANVLRFELSQEVNSDWVQSLYNMGNYSAMWGLGPEKYKISGNIVTVPTQSKDAQECINQFKNWLPRITQVYKQTIESRARRNAQERQMALNREREALRIKQEVNNNLRF